MASMSELSITVLWVRLEECRFLLSFCTEVEEYSLIPLLELPGEYDLCHNPFSILSLLFSLYLATQICINYWKLIFLNFLRKIYRKHCCQHISCSLTCSFCYSQVKNLALQTIPALTGEEDVSRMTPKREINQENQNITE